MVPLSAEYLLEKRIPCHLVIDLKVANAQLNLMLLLLGLLNFFEVYPLPREQCQLAVLLYQELLSA